MPAWGPAIKVAWKAAPIALEVARQLDRQVRPHVLAYRFARDVDGFVARWTSDDRAHWLVLPERDAVPLRAFPPLARAELDQAHRQIDRTALRHHTELPEARAKDAVARLDVRRVKLGRGDDQGGDGTGTGGTDHLDDLDVVDAEVVVEEVRREGPDRRREPPPPPPPPLPRGRR